SGRAGRGDRRVDGRRIDGREGGLSMIDVTPVAPDRAGSAALRDVWGEMLCELGAVHESLVVLDGDLANSTKADTFAKCQPDRFYEMGIAEQNLVGAAAGMASAGLVPWVSTFAAFLAKRALDQIRVVVDQPGLNVK